MNFQTRFCKKSSTLVLRKGYLYLWSLRLLVWFLVVSLTQWSGLGPKVRAKHLLLFPISNSSRIVRDMTCTRQLHCTKVTWYDWTDVCEAVESCLPDLQVSYCAYRCESNLWIDLFLLDNVFAIKSWAKRKFSLEDNRLDKAFNIPEDFDYLDWPQSQILSVVSCCFERNYVSCKYKVCSVSEVLKNIALL